ncbi:MAG TPA: methionyl-tRNA formyltransferase [Polyangium sp.]|nr:methionyl-tRNA formyltransferase [Polyangium sp.]
MRAIFFGTPAIAVPSLEALVSIAEVPLVICQPDRPAGRGLEMRAPPVKEKALALGLRVEQPTKVKTPEFAQLIASVDADVALVIAYGRILTKAVLDAPKHGCMNLHASILPKYRGAAPITWSIVNGETETGISLMQMDEGMDTGPVFTKHITKVRPDVTADELAMELGALAALVVRYELERAVRGELQAMAQEHDQATMAPILEKENGRIDWTKPAQRVHDHIRGMTSWPGAFTTLGGKTLKILSARVGTATGTPGEVIVADRSGVQIACGEGSVSVLRAQMEGRKPAAAIELVSGRVLAKGFVLGA